jgi:hypothetical protein
VRLDARAMSDLSDTGPHERRASAELTLLGVRRIGHLPRAMAVR